MKKVIIGLVIVLLIGGFFVFAKMNKQVKPKEEEAVPTPTIVLPTIPDTVSVSLTPKNGNKAVMLSVKGIPENVESVDYELTYTTSAGLPRGVLGKISTKGETSVERDDIVLGTCSSGKCVYDTGVTKVDLSLKFNTADGSSVYQKSFPLE